MDYASLMDWFNDANECIHLNFTRPSSSPAKAERIFDEAFHPNEYTSELFGDSIVNNDEIILGYKQPKVELDFRANDLQPHLNVSYKAKWDPAQAAMLEAGDAGVKQVDLDTFLHRFLPQERTDNPLGDASSKDWKPPGKRMHSFKVRSKQYEMWSVSLADPAGLALWQNMQLLPLLLIDGASPIDISEDWTHDRWTLHLLYHVTPHSNDSISPYTLAGCCTSYRYWVFPTYAIMRAIKSLPSPPPEANGTADSTSTPLRYNPPRTELAVPGTGSLFAQSLDPLSTPSRERISQFFIIPAYQGQSLGHTFYTFLFKHYHSQPNVYEIPVEDPNEQFDEMRDYADLAYLRSIPSFASLQVASSVPADMLRKDAPIPRDYILGGHSGTDITALRQQSKIVPRQFNRCLEMHLLSKIPTLNRSKNRITRKEKSSGENDRRYYFWRLAVKARIYSQNADTLDEMRKEPEKRSEVAEILANAVDGQQGEYEERFVGLDRRERYARGEDVSDMEDEDEQEEEEEEEEEEPKPRMVLKRNRAIVEDEDDEWEDMEEKTGAAKKKARS